MRIVDLDTQAAVSIAVVGLLIAGVAPAAIGGIATDVASAQTESVDDQLASKTTFWQGQTLEITIPDGSSGEVYQIRTVTDEGQVGTFVTEFVIGDQLSATIDTGRFAAGQYVVVDGDRTPLRVADNGTVTGSASTSDAAWEIAVQTLSATYDDDVVKQGDVAEIQLRSERGRYPLHVSAQTISAPVVQEMIGGELVDLNDDGTADAVRTTAIATDTIEAEIVDNVTAGLHTIELTVPDTTVSTAVTLRVEREQVVTAGLSNSVIQVDRGDIARIPINITGTTTAELEIQSGDYHATVAVNDESESGSVLVRMNTYLAGRVADERKAFSAASGGSIEEVTRHSDRREDALVADDYDLAVSVNDIQRDNSLLALTERSTEGIQVGSGPSRLSLEEALRYTGGSEQVAIQDKMTVSVTATGIEGFLTEEYDLSPNSADAREHGAFLRIQPADGSGSPVNLSAAMIQVNPSENAFVVVLPVDRASFDPGTDYTVSFVIDDRSPYVPAGEQEVVQQSVEVVERQVSVDGLEDGRLNVTIAEDGFLSLSGNATIAPGSQIIVTARSEDTSFFSSRSTQVTGSNTWRAVIRGEGISQIGNFTVQIRDDTGQISRVVPGTAAVEEEDDDNNEQTSTPTDTPDPGDDDGGASQRALVVMVGVLVVAGLFVWYVRR